MTPKKAGTDTAERILDVAEELIQMRGYVAMSFQTIAERIGIRKPSIIHHFPNKGALGLAVVARYRGRYNEVMDQLKSDPAVSADRALQLYFTPFLEFAASQEKVCLCGALACEVRGMPEPMRAEIKRFFESHQRWLEDILREGRDKDLFHFEENPAVLARLVFCALQGALLVQRTTGDSAQLEDVIEAVKNSVGLLPNERDT